jgi:hypothetical protein
LELKRAAPPQALSRDNESSELRKSELLMVRGSADALRPRRLHLNRLRNPRRSA